MEQNIISTTNNKIMRKLFIVILLIITASTRICAQLLYKISGKDLDNPSYIIGTYHLAPASFADSIAGLGNAMEQTEQVCGELGMRQMISTENTQKMGNAMLLPENTTLESILSADEQARLNTFLRSLIGTDMTNPTVRQQIGHMSPQALSTQFSLIMYMKQTPDFGPDNLFDEYFQKVAIEKGKPIIGLETMDYQLKVLFHSMNIERQKQLLMCLIDNSDYYNKITAKLIKAYFSQDINTVKTVMDEKQNTACDSTPQEDASLIYNRNTDWIRKIPVIMADKATLFTVGTGHLPGCKGLLALLRQAGYTVEAVK
ncbi:MAG: TraB/GumN family protein [Bacteroidales bacterium]|nr:TraB/GumN family protein [Bacteroidales bacterium]MCM1147265.1 TraB/GumN family protein [Bacteroidales bacterium]MCM1206302.1 TraB/GumN family protein [Bacillota bacterium]MCM1510479.1 TraB/GumN family protein [Clostridium sp.]